MLNGLMFLGLMLISAWKISKSDAAPYKKVYSMIGAAILSFTVPFIALCLIMGTG